MQGPNLFLIAAPRTGSTQLSRWLDSHPDISDSGIKELHYFSHHDFPEDVPRTGYLNEGSSDYIDQAGTRQAHIHTAIFRDYATYLALFDPVATPWRLDASTTYLSCPEAPEAINLAFPAARVITLCRDPLERALSHYRLYRLDGLAVESLRTELEAELEGNRCPGDRYLLRPSRQAEGLDRVEAIFGPTRHLALTFDDVVQDPVVTMNRIATFLDVDPSGFDLSVLARNRPGGVLRVPSLDPWFSWLGLRDPLRQFVTRHPGLEKLLKPVYFSTSNISPLYSEEEVGLLGQLLAGEAEALAECQARINAGRVGK